MVSKAEMRTRPGKSSASLYGAIALNVVALFLMGVITYGLGEAWITDYWGSEWPDIGVYSSGRVSWA